MGKGDSRGKRTTSKGGSVVLSSSRASAPANYKNITTSTQLASFIKDSTGAKVPKNAKNIFVTTQKIDGVKGIDFEVNGRYYAMRFTEQIDGTWKASEPREILESNFITDYFANARASELVEVNNV